MIRPGLMIMIPAGTVKTLLAYGACREIPMAVLGGLPVGWARLWWAGMVLGVGWRRCGVWWWLVCWCRVGSSGEGGVDLAEVEGGGGEVQFAADGVEASAGHPGQEFLEVADAGFDGGASAFVERGAFWGA